MKKKRKKKKIGLIFKIAFLTGIILSLSLLYRIKRPAVVTRQKEKQNLYIPSHASFQTVKDSMKKFLTPPDLLIFSTLAYAIRYDKHIHPGRYIIPPRASIWEIIKMLYAGRQTPVKVIFHNIRTDEGLCEHISRQLEFTKDELCELLHNEDTAQNYGFTTSTFLTMFIPNTYEFYWNTSASAFLRRMASEYKKFWNNERKALARSLGLTQSEVSILASIVQAEQLSHPDEWPIIAGLYINRLRKGIPLQSDPTVIYAMKNFSVKRVLKTDLTIDSPYNTYKYNGLPPGPILLPSPEAIDAVLHYTPHSFLYMCAKDDLSGYHAFASTYEEHLRNAQLYQKKLNQIKLMR